MVIDGRSVCPKRFFRLACGETIPPHTIERMSGTNASADERSVLPVDRRVVPMPIGSVELLISLKTGGSVVGAFSQKGQGHALRVDVEGLN